MGKIWASTLFVTIIFIRDLVKDFLKSSGGVSIAMICPQSLRFYPLDLWYTVESFVEGDNLVKLALLH